MDRLKIDEDDRHYLTDYRWYLNKGYLTSRINGITTGLHRLIAGARPGEVVDHINGDTLDNRKSNLRIVSVQGNSLNRKLNSNNLYGWLGVSKTDFGYVAQIKVDGKMIGLGTFETPEMAGQVVEVIRDLRDWWLDTPFDRRNFGRNS